MSVQFGPGTVDRTTQLNWYVNKTTGNDGNDGLTSGSALKTVTAWFLKSCSNGYYTFNTAGIIVHIETDLLTTDHPVGEYDVGLMGSIEFIGTKTTVYTSAGGGSVTRTAANPAAAGGGTPWILVDTNLASFAPYVAFQAFSNSRVRTTALASNPNAVAWPMKATAANTGRLSTPMIPTRTQGVFGQSNTTIANGDPYVIETLPLIYDWGLKANVIGLSFASEEPVTFVDLAFTTSASFVQLDSNDANLGGKVGYYGCSFNNNILLSGDYINCRFTGMQAERGGYFVGGMAAADVFINNGFAIIDQQFAGQDATIAVGSQTQLASVQLYDATGSGSVLTNQTGTIIAQAFLGAKLAFGSSATPAGFFRIEPNGRNIYDDTTGLTGLGSAGAGGAVQLGGGSAATPIPYTSLPYVELGTLSCMVSHSLGIAGGFGKFPGNITIGGNSAFTLLNGNVVGIRTTDGGGGQGVLGIANATVVPPISSADGPVIYGEGGAVKGLGMSGTRTTMAPT